MLPQFLQFLFSGVTIGATYALAALGFSIIYNASGVINFAQGEFIMLGGMSAVFLIGAGISRPLGVLLAGGLACPPRRVGGKRALPPGQDPPGGGRVYLPDRP